MDAQFREVISELKDRRDDFERETAYN